MDLVRYVRVLRRRWRLIAVAAVIGSIAGLLVTARFGASDKDDGEQRYLAVNTLFVSGTGNNVRQRNVNLNRLAAQATITPIAERVARAIGGDPAALQRQVTARTNEQLNAIEIIALGSNPERTAALANEFAKQLIRHEQDQARRAIDDEMSRLEEQRTALGLEQFQVPATDVARRDALDRQIAALDAEIQTLRSKTAAAGLNSVEEAVAVPASGAQIEAAFTRAAPSQGNNRNQQAQTFTGIAPTADSGGLDIPVPLGGLIGLVFGGGIGVVLVLAINTIDPRIFTKEDAEAALGFRVIAEVPVFSRKLQRESIIISREAPYSRFAEAYRVLRSSILFAEGKPVPGVTAPDQPGTNGHDEHDDGEQRSATVIMITSPGPSEGKTTTVSNLATVLAEDGRSVLVVNCDFRRPHLHAFLGGGAEPRQVFDTEVPGVKLVTGVVEDPSAVAPAEVISAQQRLIANARQHFDYILLDTAPILTTNDASELLPVTDMVAMICRSGKTNREAADRAAELLERFDASVIGAVLVGATDTPSRQYYYYYSHPRAADEEAEDDADNPLANLSDAAFGDDGTAPPTGDDGMVPADAASGTDQTKD